MSVSKKSMLVVCTLMATALKEKKIMSGWIFMGLRILKLATVFHFMQRYTDISKQEMGRFWTIP